MRLFKEILILSLVVTNSYSCEKNLGLYHLQTYVGLSIGHSHTQAKLHDKFYIFKYVDSAIKTTSNRDAIMGDFKFGLRYTLDSQYLFGLELVTAVTNNKVSKKFKIFENDDNVFTNTIKLKSQYRLLPLINVGLKINDRVNILVKIGPSINHFKIRHTNVEDDNADGTDLITKEVYRKTSTGLYIGLGAEYTITQSVSLTGDLSYESYKKIKRDYLQYSTIPNKDFHFTVKPRMTTVKLGIIYKF